MTAATDRETIADVAGIGPPPPMVWVVRQPDGTYIVAGMKADGRHGDVRLDRTGLRALAHQLAVHLGMEDPGGEA